MQEAATLQPLSVGEVIDRVIGLLRTRPLLYVAIVAIPALVVAVLQRLVGISRTFDLSDFIPTFGPSGQATIPSLASQPTGAGPFAVQLLAILVGTVQAAALVYAVSRRYLGSDTTFGDAYTAGLRATLRIIGAGIVGALVFGLVFGVALVALTFIAGLVVAGGGSTGAIILLVLGIPLVMILAVVVILSLFVVVPAVVIEGAGPIAALRRSWQLTAGHRGRVLGVTLLLLALQIVLGIVFSTLFFVSFVSDPTMRTVLQELANLGATVVETPLLWATVVVLYYDLRVRKEALDLQLAAESLARA